MDEVIGAFTVREAAGVVGLSEATITRWARKGVITPAFIDSSRWLGFRYALSFRDLVTLRTMRQLKALGVPAIDLARAAAFLQRNYGRPWAALRIGVDGHDVVYYEAESDDLISASHPGQKVAKGLVRVALLADEVAASVRKARTRQPDQIGKVTQSKHVMEDAVVLAGTRIPVSTILDFHHDGYSVDGILAEYPELHPEDVQAAIEYETLFGRQTA
jgi:uncharacterized protein (DUF433 family)